MRRRQVHWYPHLERATDRMLGKLHARQENTMRESLRELAVAQPDREGTTRATTELALRTILARLTC